MRTKNALIAVSLKLIFLLLVIVSIEEYTNLTIASIFGFVAMSLGYITGIYLPTVTPFQKALSFGLGSGSMLMSAFVIIVPKAVTSDSAFITGIGAGSIAIGFIIGYVMHESSHIYSHIDTLPNFKTIPFFEITIHSLLAGVLMGITYSTIPEAGLLLGFSILAHKYPAGLVLTVGKSEKLPLWYYLLPALSVGYAGITTAYLIPSSIPTLIQVIIIGISAGVFIHVAVDMIPECVGHEHNSHSHGKIVCSSDTDKFRIISACSVITGAIFILILWLFINM